MGWKGGREQGRRTERRKKAKKRKGGLGEEECEGVSVRRKEKGKD